MLIEAGAGRATAIVTTLPNDALNLFITLTARNLNGDIYIVAKCDFPTSEKKFRQAGANRVVMPSTIGARSMARMILKPSTADFVELVAETKRLDVDLDELRVPEGCLLDGVRVRAARVDHYRLLFVAVKRSDGELIFNPDPDFKFRGGDILLTMGTVEGLASFREAYGLVQN